MRPACWPWSSPACCSGTRRRSSSRPRRGCPSGPTGAPPVPAREHGLPADRPADPVDPRRRWRLSPLPGWLIAAATHRGLPARSCCCRPIWLSRPRSLLPARPRPDRGRDRCRWQAADRRVVGRACAGWSRWPRSSLLPEDTPHREVLVLHRARRRRPARCSSRARRCPGWCGGSGCPARIRRRTRCRRPPYCKVRTAPAEAKLAGDRHGRTTRPRWSTAPAAWRGRGRRPRGSGSGGRRASTRRRARRYRRLRIAMLEAEREHILKVRDAGLVADEVLQRAQIALDIEESHPGPRRGRRRGRPVRGPAGQDLAGRRLRAPRAGPWWWSRRTRPRAARSACATAAHWVHLRLCLGCGHVGCCDSSPMKHASKHYDETEHPVMRSFEPGETWRWCFVDEKLG